MASEPEVDCLPRTAAAHATAAGGAASAAGRVEAAWRRHGGAHGLGVIAFCCRFLRVFIASSALYCCAWLYLCFSASGVC